MMDQRARSKYPGGNPGQTLVVLRVLVADLLAAGFFVRVVEVFRLGFVLVALRVLRVFAFVFFDPFVGMTSS